MYVCVASLPTKAGTQLLKNIVYYLIYIYYLCTKFERANKASAGDRSVGERR